MEAKRGKSESFLKLESLFWILWRNYLLVRHYDFAFENEDVINLDLFSAHGLLY
jgi:hypothetical protein